MANTYVDYTGNGSTTDFNFSFPYIKTSHVVVQVNEGQGAGGLNKWVPKVLTTDYSVETSPTTFVRFVTAPANNVRVRVLRDSDASTGLVDFANGSVLTETELDNSYEHNRYLAEEAEEGITGGSLVKNTDGQFDADGLRLENLADPDSDDDAVNKGYADNRYVDVAGDTMTGNLNMGTNKVTSSTAPSDGNDLTNKTYVDDTFVDVAGDTMTGELNMGDNKITNLAGPTNELDAANKNYVDDTITTAFATGTPPPGNQIGTNVIEDGAITTDKIADDAVTADKLDDTGVTPGSYTNTDLTVDAQGRITAASNGTPAATNLGNTPAASNVLITSSTGTDTTVPSATTALAGVMSSADKTKLDGIAAGATANTGTVTEVETGTGLTGGPITGSGTIALDAGGVGTNQLADGSVTSDKISSTDTLLNTNTTQDTIGIGATANSASAFPKVKMDGGVQIGDQAHTITGTTPELVVSSSTNTVMSVENTGSSDNAVIVVKGPSAILQLNDTDATNGVYNVQSAGGTLRIDLINGGVATSLLSLDSSGNLIISGSLTQNGTP